MTHGATWPFTTSPSPLDGFQRSRGVAHAVVHGRQEAPWWEMSEHAAVDVAAARQEGNDVRQLLDALDAHEALADDLGTAGGCGDTLLKGQ